MRIIALALLGLLLGPGVGRAQTVEYYLLDALGSVRVVTDSTGQIVRDAQGQEVGRHEFEPFGEELQPLTTRDRKLFTGQERDHESGLDYFGARYYRADLGRFTTVDPVLDQQAALTDPQLWNRYAYVRNNPLKYTDPDGKFPVAVAAAVPGPQQIFVVGGLAVVGSVYIYKERETIASSLQGAWSALTSTLSESAATAGRWLAESWDATSENLDRMRNGQAPKARDGKSVELHHEGQNPEGPVREMTQQEHRGPGKYTENHPRGNKEPSKIDRTEAARQRQEYWKKVAKELEKKGQQ